MWHPPHFDTATPIIGRKIQTQVQILEKAQIHKFVFVFVFVFVFPFIVVPFSFWLITLIGWWYLAVWLLGAIWFTRTPIRFHQSPSAITISNIADLENQVNLRSSKPLIWVFLLIMPGLPGSYRILQFSFQDKIHPCMEIWAGMVQKLSWCCIRWSAQVISLDEVISFDIIRWSAQIISLQCIGAQCAALKVNTECRAMSYSVFF